MTTPSPPAKPAAPGSTTPSPTAKPAASGSDGIGFFLKNGHKKSCTVNVGAKKMAKELVVLPHNVPWKGERGPREVGKQVVESLKLALDVSPFGGLDDLPEALLGELRAKAKLARIELSVASVGL